MNRLVVPRLSQSLEFNSQKEQLPSSWRRNLCFQGHIGSGQLLSGMCYVLIDGQVSVQQSKQVTSTLQMIRANTTVSTAVLHSVPRPVKFTYLLLKNAWFCTLCPSRQMWWLITLVLHMLPPNKPFCPFLRFSSASCSNPSGQVAAWL